MIPLHGNDSCREPLSNGAHCYFCHLIYKPATVDGFGLTIPTAPGVDTHGVFPEPGKERSDAGLLAFLEMGGVLCLTAMSAELLTDTALDGAFDTVRPPNSGDRSSVGWPDSRTPAMRRVAGGRAQDPALEIPSNTPNSTDQRSRAIIRSRDLPSSVAEPGPELKE
jgi:hypothetical protein